jgi:tetratricopeptide (TPR) repeat protein
MFVRSACLLILALVVSACSHRSEFRAVAPNATNNSAASDPASDIAQADQFYRERDDLQRLEQGIVLLRQAATTDPNSYEANWRLAKFSYYLARHTDGEYRHRAFRDGIDAGKVAVQLQADKPDGHFWLGANYGGALESGSFGLASLGDVRKEMDTVLKIDEGYQDGSAYMVLGLVDLKAPYIAGGDRQRAVTEMERGLQFGKANAFLRLHLAEAYQAVGRTADAREQLNTILSMTPDPDYLPELKEAQTQAQQLLAKVSQPS